MSYTVIINDKAKEHIGFHKRSGNKPLFNKLNMMLEELEEHPDTGTGKPEKLKGNLSGLWSRRINKEHRLIYAVNEKIITVIVVSAKGHYD